MINKSEPVREDKINSILKDVIKWISQSFLKDQTLLYLLKNNFLVGGFCRSRRSQNKKNGKRKTWTY